MQCDFLGRYISLLCLFNYNGDYDKENDVYNYWSVHHSLCDRDDCLFIKEKEEIVESFLAIRHKYEMVDI